MEKFNIYFKQIEPFLCYENFAENQNLYFPKTWIFELKIRFVQNSSKYKNMIFETTLGMLHMDRNTIYKKHIYIVVFDLNSKNMFC